MNDVTPPLDEFRRDYEADDNVWWAMACGHHQNLFEAACEQLDDAREENARLLAQAELLEAAVDQDVTIRELAAKMRDDGSINVKIVAGEEGISHPGIRVLAAAALSLLELDGTVPSNYRTAQMSGRLATGETYFVEMAACKSKNQTPHELRMKAEAERDAARALLTKIIYDGDPIDVSSLSFTADEVKLLKILTPSKDS